MDKRDLLLKKWEETARGMKKEIQAQNEVIDAQKQQIHHLGRQITRACVMKTR